MDENFNGNRRLRTDEADFLSRQLTRQDSLCEAIGFQETDAVQIGHRHLRTSVKWQVGRDFPGQGRYSQILDDDAIDAERVEALQIRRQSL